MGTLFVIAFYLFDVIRVAQNEGVVNCYSYSIAARDAGTAIAFYYIIAMFMNLLYAYVSNIAKAEKVGGLLWKHIGSF